MEQNRDNRFGRGFDDAPNMVPGEFEVAQQYEPNQDRGQGASPAVKVLAVFATLAVAGGMGYVNQDQIRESLGYQTPVSQCAAAEYAVDPSEVIPCDEDAVCVQEGDCPSESQPVGFAGSCCEQSRKSAVAAAMLQGVRLKTEEELAAEAQARAETQPHAESPSSNKLAVTPVAAEGVDEQVISANAVQETAAPLETQVADEDTVN